MNEPARRLWRHPTAEPVLVVCLLVLACGAARAASNLDEFKVIAAGAEWAGVAGQ